LIIYGTPEAVMMTSGYRVGNRFTRSSISFRLDPGRLDDRPPFLCIGFHQRAERLRGLLFARKNLKPEIDEPRSYRRIGQCWATAKRVVLVTA
jgi:hypothetical protein